MTADMLADFRCEVLGYDGVLAHFRCVRERPAASVLLIQAASPEVEDEAVRQMKNEMALADLLDESWAVKPLRSIWRASGMALVYADEPFAALEQHFVGAADIDRFLALAIHCTIAVRRAHEAGLLHRNIKPAHLRIDSAGECRLTGFGLARRIGLGCGTEVAPLISGTPAYMSPEHTGRTRRPIDTRSDLYSLGVTLYELLTGRLPFDLGEDGTVGEWLHCHVASPPRPTTSDDAVPEMVAEVLLKCLAKNPELRYQSAAGLEADLKRCHQAWQSEGGIAPFALGRRDRGAQLVFPDRLYDRDESLQRLRAAWLQVAASGSQALVVVCGASGVGKSSLLAAFQSSLRGTAVNVAIGKVDQFRHAVPYAALTEALRGLLLQILGEREDVLRFWRARIERTLGANADVAANLLPELQILYGLAAQPPVGLLKGLERRSEAVMFSLLYAFACAERPLILVIDDAQWLDPASIALLDSCLAAPLRIPLLLVVSSRDDVAAAANLSALRRATMSCVEIALHALDLAATEQLLADVLHTPRHMVAGLAEFLHGKTLGNPFFVKQWIQSLVDDGLIAWSSNKRRWRIALRAIVEQGYADNPVDLVLHRLDRMPEPTRKVLGGLACLGRRGGLPLLCALNRCDAAAMQAILAPALDDTIVVFNGDIVGFGHDRVQEAAYQYLSAAERNEIHLGVGRWLADVADADGGDDAVLGAVEHLNQVRNLLGAEEQLGFAGLFLRAARTVRGAGAYRSALEYAHGAAGLLEHSGGHHPALAFAISLELAGCEFFCGNFNAASLLVDELLAGTATLIGRSEACRLRVEIQLRRGQYRAAVDTALDGLRAFGIDLPATPSIALCDEAHAAIGQLLAGDYRRRFHALPALCDPEVEAAMGLLSALSIPVSFIDGNLHFLQLYHTVRLTLAHGMTGASVVSLAWLGVLAGHRYGEYLEGFAYGELAQSLVMRPGYSAWTARTLLPFDQLSVWTRSLDFSTELVMEGFAAAIANGDTTIACFAKCHLICNLLARADALDSVSAEAGRALLYVRQAGFADVEAILTVQQQFIDILRGAGTSEFSGETLLPDYKALLPAASAEPMSTLVFWYWLYKGITHYLAGEVAAAANCLDQAGSLSWSAPGHIHLLDLHLFSALTLAAMDATAEGRARLDGHARQVEQWAAVNPATFADKDALLQGERARLDGDVFAALGHYERAIALAAQGGFHQCAAIAHELAAGLCQASGLDTGVAAHARGARDAYRRWGAHAKARQLENRFPLLGDSGANRSRHTVSVVETAQIRDIDSVIRSARALSEEIHVEELVRALLTLALEHAGAQRGLLLRMHGKTPLIVASAVTTPDGIQVRLMRQAPGIDDLPAAMLHAAIRTQLPVRIDGGQGDGPLRFDPYLQRHDLCAALCMPMLKQSQLIGVLYLENRLASEGFSNEQSKVLELLAAQAAISLETARLYAELVEENLHRQRVEKALGDSEATLRLGEQISQSGSWRWDIERNLMLCSTEFRRIFGFGPDHAAISYRAFLERVHPDDRAMVHEQCASSLRERSQGRIVYRVLLPDGRLRYLASIGNPDAEGKYWVGTATDITERRAAEDSLRLAQADLARVTRATTVGQLTASVAHEINQPLMAIASNANASLRWMRRDPPHLAEAEAGLLAIAEQSRRAGDIIHSLQALTRNTPTARAEVDVHATIDHIVAICRSELDRREVTVQLALAAPRCTVMGASVQLQQVLLNLVVNAIDAIQAGGQERLLTIGSRQQGQERLRIDVDDTGVGLSVGDAGKIFAPFYTTKENGMGMGLSICRSIVDAHGGTLEAQPRLGGGTRFTLLLPLH